MGKHLSKAARPAYVLDPDRLGRGPLLAVLWRFVALLLMASRLGGVRLPDRELPAWREADALARRIRRAWPALGAMADPADIGPALDRALYQLAVLLGHRNRLDRSLAELDDAVRGLSPASGLRAEVAERREQLAAGQAEVTARIGDRLGALRRLAELSGEHAFQAHRAEAARRALSRAVASEPPPVEDTVAAVAERTAVVLEAYRELTDE